MANSVVRDSTTPIRLAPDFPLLKKGGELLLCYPHTLHAAFYCGDDVLKLRAGGMHPADGNCGAIW